MFCKNCGEKIPDGEKYCPYCGTPVDIESDYDNAFYNNAYIASKMKSRIAAGLLNIFLPGIGRLYLGYTGIGIGQLVLSCLFGAGYIWSFIDGIFILTGSVDRDADGFPLKS